MKFAKIAPLFLIGFISATSYAETVEPTTQSNGTQAMSSTIDANAAGDAFLAENKKKEGVVSMPSGLQYKILVPGDGAIPRATDTVTVHYVGTLINGKEFDSSIKRGQPATFPVNGVIQGWVEALQLMKVGSTWELFIPATLAYGARGAPPAIGPNETLIFKVQLLSINK